MADDLRVGSMVDTNTSRGFSGLEVNFGVGSVTIGYNQDGSFENSLSWGNDFFNVGADPNDGGGWNLPLGIVSVGESYTSSGTYGNFTVGHPMFGYTFSVHGDNPNTKYVCRQQNL